MSEVSQTHPFETETFRKLRHDGTEGIDWGAVEAWGRTVYPAYLGERGLDSVGMHEPSYETDRKLNLRERANLLDATMDERQPQATRDMLGRDDSMLIPNLELTIDDRKFLLSKPFTVGEYSHVVSYSVDDEGVMTPRLLYRSNSDGSWRATLGLKLYGGDDYGYKKSPDSSDGAYVQDTRLDDRLVRAIEKQEDKYDDRQKELAREDFFQYFGYKNVIDAGLNTFDAERSIKKFDDDPSLARLYDTYEPGVGYKVPAEEARQLLTAPDLLPDEFVPDFRQAPQSVETIEHSMVGEITVSTYTANYQGEFYTWHVAEDQSGGVWLNKISMPASRPTSYGTASQVVAAGLLSEKAFAYSRDTAGMEAGRDYDRVEDSRYVDLRDKFWGQMHWVKQYKQLKNTTT